MPAFPTGWGRRCELKVQASKVSANLSNFPVLLTKDTLPSEMFDADGLYPALNGGGDVRFTAAVDSSNRLACEVVRFVTDNNPANGIAEIWVKVPSVSSSVDTSIWVWYNKTGETQPGEGDTYGSEAVWDADFLFVAHLNDLTATTIKDSTSNDFDGVKKATGEPVEADGAWAGGKAQDFDGSDDYINSTCDTTIDTDWTLSAWIKIQALAASTYGTILGTVAEKGAHDPLISFYYDFPLDGDVRHEIRDGNGLYDNVLSPTQYTLNQWHHVVCLRNSVTDKLWFYFDGNGQSADANTADSFDISGYPYFIGAVNGTGVADLFFNGLIDEARISKTVRAPEWITSSRNNQDDPSTFVLEQTSESTFPEAWGRKCELKIQASKVATTLSNFPVLLTEDTLPSEMFDADGLYPALAGGGDIRFTSDAEGTTRLACEIVTFAIDNDPANGVGQIWVNVASISSVTDTSIWVWYNKAGESQPARAAAYGMEATWNSSFVGVWHLDETSGNAIDSTSHTTDGTLSGGVTRQATGPVGKGYSFDGIDGQVSMGDPIDGHLDFGTGSFTAAIWVVVSGTTGDYQMPLWKGGSATVRPGYCWVTSGPPSGFYPNVNDVEQDRVSMEPGFPLTWDVWMHSVIVRDAGADLFRGYKDGVPITPATDISIVGDIDTTDDFLLSRLAKPFYGLLDEVRMSDVIRSAGWISSSYNNQYDPASFVIEQTPQSLYERKLEGVTYDKTGSILGSCECYLFKDNLDDSLTYVAYTLSDAGTGAYSFTGIYDDSAQYIVVAWKDDTPHIFDVTDHVLLPVVV